MDLLKLRKVIKSKKPNFVRQDSVLKGIANKWRKPKGLQSKLRLKKAGHMKTPSPGYRSPKKVRFLDPNGLTPILIKNIHDLDKIKENNSAILSSTLGLRKKLQILEKIKESKIKLLNLGNIEEFIKKSNEKLSKNKEFSIKRKARKQKSKEKTKKEEEKKTEDEKKDEEKKEEKQLTKKLEQTQQTPKQDIQKAKTQIMQATAPKQK